MEVTLRKAGRLVMQTAGNQDPPDFVNKITNECMQ